MKRKRILPWLAVLAFFAILARAALRDGLTVREYTVFSEYITAPHTFVIVSDLHATEYGEDQSELLRLIEAFSPDAVLMPGDMTHESRSAEPCRILLETLSQKYPCYLTVGNHDRWSNISPDMKETYAAYGVVVLSDSTAEIQLGSDTFRLHGVDDPLFYQSEEDFRNAVSALQTEEDTFDILLSHRPEYAALYASCGFDLTLSGHAHGGQVRIPFLLNGLYAPHQGWFPSYAGGLYEIGSTHTVVSRGLMIDDIPRVFNPPEVVVVTVRPPNGNAE